MDKEKAERIIKIINWVKCLILVVFLTFAFVGLTQAQTTHDFGMWISAGAEKKFTADWDAGIGTELRTKHRREYIDRWKLDIYSMYRIHRHLKLGAAYEFHLKNQTTGSETISLPHHRFMADVVPTMSVNGWLHLSLRERYQYTYRMARHDIDAQHEHHLITRRYEYLISLNNYILDCTCCVRPCGRGEQCCSTLIITFRLSQAYHS